MTSFFDFETYDFMNEMVPITSMDQVSILDDLTRIETHAQWVEGFQAGCRQYCITSEFSGDRFHIKDDGKDTCKVYRVVENPESPGQFITASEVFDTWTYTQVNGILLGL